MGLKLEPKEGDTELSPEELDLLIPNHITTENSLTKLNKIILKKPFNGCLL